MTLAAAVVLAPLMGHAKPRIAPPIPARTNIKAFRETAQGMGIELMPWQETAARYLTATDQDGLLLYRDICIVVARQNGKTWLMKPHIIRSLRAGKKILHIAQTRELPRQMFELVADNISKEPGLLPTRRGRTIWPRFGAGQEEIKLQNGAEYRIAAANRGGARGGSYDIVIIDELREMKDNEVIGAAEPTLTMSPDPQMIYLSNAGEDDSVILNDVRGRAGTDPNLAYLEWSAAPERTPDDREGWVEANPALGHYPQLLRTLEADYIKGLTRGMALFETEHLCRWVTTMREQLVDGDAWKSGESVLEEPARPFMAVGMDPGGRRASAAIAWPRADGSSGLRLLFDVTGNPIDTDRLGADLKATAKRMRVPLVGFDPITDAVLAKHFPRTEPITGKKYANGSARFVALVEAGKVKWSDAGAVGDDLLWTARKPHESGTFEAVRAQDDRPITAVNAAIRALWLASTPRPLNRPVVRGF